MAAVTLGSLPQSIKAIGILTLVEGALLVAAGLSIVFADSYVSDMTLLGIFHIDPGAFLELRAALGSVAAALGASSLAAGAGLLGMRAWAWLSNVASASLTVAVMLVLLDLDSSTSTATVLLFPLVTAGIILACMLGPGVRPFFNR